MMDDRKTDWKARIGDHAPGDARSALRNSGWWIAFGGSLAVALVAMSPPVLAEGARDVVMAMFSGVCHQLPGRSPHVDGVQLAVCHRCSGIYWGLPAAALLFAVAGKMTTVMRSGAPLLLFAAAAPAVLDWALDLAGVWTNTPVTRVLTGAVFGLGAGWFLVLATTGAGSRQAADVHSDERMGAGPAVREPDTSIHGQA